MTQMMHYWQADCIRILRRVPRIIATAAILVIYAIAVIYISTKTSWNSVTFLAAAASGISMAMIALGLVEFGAVFSDDLKAKSIQAAIGMGISRKKVVLTKYLEIGTIALLDLVCLGLATGICGALTDISLTAAQMAEAIHYLSGAWISIVAYCGAAMIFAFLLQGTGIASLVYLGLSLTFVDSLLEKALNLQVIRGLHLSQYLLSKSLESLNSKLILGIPDAGTMIRVAVYIVGFYLITVALFRRHELEF